MKQSLATLGTLQGERNAEVAERWEALLQGGIFRDERRGRGGLGGERPGRIERPFEGGGALGYHRSYSARSCLN